MLSWAGLYSLTYVYDALSPGVLGYQSIINQSVNDVDRRRLNLSLYVRIVLKTLVLVCNNPSVELRSISGTEASLKIMGRCSKKVAIQVQQLIQHCVTLRCLQSSITDRQPTYVGYEKGIKQLNRVSIWVSVSFRVSIRLSVWSMWYIVLYLVVLFRYGHWGVII